MRRKVESQIGRIAEDLWALAEEANLDFAVADGDLTVEELARKLRRVAKQPRSRREPADFHRDRLSDATIERGRLLSLVYARMANGDGAVLAVRQEIEHRPTPPGFARWVKRQLAADREAARVGTPSFAFSYLDGLEVVEVEAPVGGLLNQVDDVVHELASELPWRRERIAQWVVCGAPVPPVVHVRVDLSGVIPVNREVWAHIDASFRPLFLTDTLSRVNLTVDPALSPAEMAAVWSQVRARLIGDDAERIRPPEARALALAKFALQQTESLSEAPWGRWLNEWTGTTKA